jgi:hypothetical protein
MKLPSLARSGVPFKKYREVAHQGSSVTRAEIRRQDLRPAKGTLADDVGQYLKLVEPRLVSFKDREYDLRQWLDRFGHRHRHTLD